MSVDVAPGSSRAAGPSRVPRRHRLRQSLAWVVAVLLAAAAVLHAVGPESDAVLILLRAVTPVLYLPAYATLVAGLVRRRWLLAVLSAVVVAAHLAWVAPAIGLGRLPAAPSGSVRLRVLSANVLFQNPSQGRVAEVALRERADIVVLVELTPQGWASASAGLHPVLPYSDAHPTRASDGYGVLSRYPLRLLSADTVGGRALPRYLIAVPGAEPVVLHLVHATAPVESVRAWTRQHGEVRRSLAPDGRRAFAAGDFNATRWNRPFAALLRAGWRDVRPRGSGWLPTWRVGRILPPLLEIDHVLVGRAFTPLAIRSLPPQGSDHHALLVDLAVSRR